MKHKIKFTLIIISILLITNFILLPNLLFASSLEDQLDSIKREKEETIEKIKDVKKSESEIINQVNEVEEKLLESLSELEELNKKLDNINKSISENTVDLMIKSKELDEIEIELDKKIQILNDRVASIYKYGNSNFFELFMNSESFLEFFSKIKLLNIIAQEDINIIQEIRDERQKLLNVKKNIIELKGKKEENKKEVERLLSQAGIKRDEIESIYNEKKALLEKTQQDKNALIAMDRQLTAKENEIKNALRNLTHGSAPTGKLLWPTSGRLSSGFGPRGGRLHSGIDIYCRRGTPIIAADSGQVIQTGYHRGYGYFILIYHGGGFATFYAHLDGFAVSGGQSVSRGQTIGYVGTTGWTTGPHLHFEVRINGVAKNPMSYF